MSPSLGSWDVRGAKEPAERNGENGNSPNGKKVVCLAGEGNGDPYRANQGDADVGPAARRGRLRLVLIAPGSDGNRTSERASRRGTLIG